ncbi:hypothetical protein HPB51_013136 [Rhipicephalus microplus]|uniref:Uncharacterized protein n=1 Tax=Rhipicephalus microplus TaxID=6941 RepID=A0A9J6E1Q7_RHIMP|nr:hypothetical protein HPB51_013136 [Rhipicephalus microplus]
MNLALGKGFSVRALRERLDLLMAQFLANDRASLRKSGTEEEYEEKERLLQEISSLARDFGHKIKSRKAQPSAGQRVSGVVTRDTAAATLGPASQVAFGRRRAQAATASVDYEFIEKRWRHERALKEKEHALEMECLATEKLRIERKQERSEKRHELKRDRTERELQLREREMEIRECQLQAQLDEASQREQLSRFHKAT